MPDILLIQSEPIPKGVIFKNGRLFVPFPAALAFSRWLEFHRRGFAWLDHELKGASAKARRAERKSRPKAGARRWKPGQLKRFRATMAAKRAAKQPQNGAVTATESSRELAAPVSAST
jgi:hypothetical protein